MRIKYLDGVRGVASLMVVVYHIINSHWSYHTMAKASFFLFNGSEAVSLFFVLSGIVLSKTFLDATEGIPQINYTKYALSRLFRLLPLYWVVIIISYLYFHNKELGSFYFYKDVLMNKQHLYQQLLLVRGYLDKICLPAWSLAVELIVSLLLPIFIFTFRINKKLFYFLFPILFFAQPHFISVFFIHFLLGIIIAASFTKIENNEISFLQKNKVSILVMSVLLFSCRHMLHFLQIPTVLQNVANNILALDTYFITAFGAAGLLVLLINSSKAQRFFESKIVLFLGEISYSMYLIHHLIITIFINHILQLENQFGKAKALVIMGIGVIVCTFLFSFLLHKCIEKPFIALGKKVVGKFKM